MWGEDRRSLYKFNSECGRALFYVFIVFVWSCAHQGASCTKGAQWCTQDSSFVPWRERHAREGASAVLSLPKAQGMMRPRVTDYVVVIKGRAKVQDNRVPYREL